MGIRSRISRWLAGPVAVEPNRATRHERRLAAKRRHRETGGPLWTSADRKVGGGGSRVVADVAPGTPGHHASVHTVEDRKRAEP